MNLGVVIISVMGVVAVTFGLAMTSPQVREKGDDNISISIRNISFHSCLYGGEISADEFKTKFNEEQTKNIIGKCKKFAEVQAGN